MTERRALVSGATGFIGSRLCGCLAAAGWRVAALVRPGRSVDDADEMLESTAGASGLCRFFRRFRPDAVFHLAACAREQTPGDVGDVIACNISLGAQILEAMARSGIRNMINTGSSWQNADPDRAEYSPNTLYAASKQAFEAIIEYYAAVRGLRAVTLRLFDTYGEGDGRRKFLNAALAAVDAGEPLGMTPGDQEIDLVHVDDVCQAFLRAFALVSREDAPPHAVYGVSSGERIRLRELAERIGRVTGGKADFRFGARPYRKHEVMFARRHYEPLPGWKPSVGLDEGLERFFLRRSLPGGQGE